MGSYVILIVVLLGEPFSWEFRKWLLWVQIWLIITIILVLTHKKIMYSTFRLSSK